MGGGYCERDKHFNVQSGFKTTGTGGFSDMSTLKLSSQKWPINFPGSSVECWTEIVHINQQYKLYTLYHMETAKFNSNINYSVILHQTRAVFWIIT